MGLKFAQHQPIGQALVSLHSFVQQIYPVPFDGSGSCETQSHHGERNTLAVRWGAGLYNRRVITHCNKCCETIRTVGIVTGGDLKSFSWRSPQGNDFKLDLKNEKGTVGQRAQEGP